MRLRLFGRVESFFFDRKHFFFEIGVCFLCCIRALRSWETVALFLGAFHLGASIGSPGRTSDDERVGFAVSASAHLQLGRWL